MKNVSQDMQDALPTDFDTSVNLGVDSNGRYSGIGYNEMLTAFMDALGNMKIELDDEVAGRFVETTVAKAIYV